MKERLPIESGTLLIIDQFMLGNSQFVEAAKESCPDLNKPDAESLGKATAEFGGFAISLEEGGYSVHRDPKRRIMAVCPEDSAPPEAPPRPPRGVEVEEEEDEQRAMFFENIIQQRPESGSGSKVSVDTRCLAFVDAGILGKSDVLDQFRSMRLRGKEKDARDFLREHGATVRYGFERDSEVLTVAAVDGSASIGLWGELPKNSGRREASAEN